MILFKTIFLLLEGKVERLVLLMAGWRDRTARGATFIWPSIAATAGHAAEEGGKIWIIIIRNFSHWPLFAALLSEEIYCYNNSGGLFRVFFLNSAAASDWNFQRSDDWANVSEMNAGNAVKWDHLNERHSRNLSPPNANNAETWRMLRAHLVNGSMRLLQLFSALSENG